MNISLQNHVALNRVMFVYLVRSAEPKNVGKCRLLTITVLWTRSVSHSFVAIFDLLIFVAETVSQPGLHCQALKLPKTVSLLSVDFYFIFIRFAYCWMDFFFCTTLERLAPIFMYLRVARQFCCRGPKFIFSFISLSLVLVSLRHCQQNLFQLPSAQNITIKCFLLHPQCNAIAIIVVTHNYKGFIKMKRCASIVSVVIDMR